MMNDGRWLDVAGYGYGSRAALLRALAAHARGVGDAPMVCKWGTLAEPVVRQAHHERGVAHHERGVAHYERGVAHYERGVAHYERGVAHHERGVAHHERGVAHHERGVAHHERDVAHHERDVAYRERESARPELVEGSAFQQRAAGGPLTFVASTGSVDRHGDTVAPEGWRLDAYRENPVVLWAHDYRRPAIGRAQSVWRDGGALLARLEFADTEFAREVDGLYRQGYQQGVSVGFRPLRFEERRDARTGAFLGIRFLEQELLEISAVPVPANQAALMTQRADVATEVLGLLRALRP